MKQITKEQQEELTKLLDQHADESPALRALLPGPDVWEGATVRDPRYHASARRGILERHLLLKIESPAGAPAVLDKEDAAALRDMLNNFLDGRRLDGGEE